MWLFIRCWKALMILTILPISVGHASDGNDTKPFQQLLEISFGQSQLFIEPTHRDLAQNNTVERLPTTSALFLAEWLFSEKLSLMGAFTLPLTTQQILIDGELYHEKAAPTASVGLRWSAVGFEVRKGTRIEIQLAGLVGTSIGSQLGDIVFPTLGSRVVLLRVDGFGLYAGSTWSFRRDTLALIYGIGHRF
ncbi:MAG: hypothetical protein VYA30_02030 [Myxococcota bacterium]|nr:hypothetical protein [Myxococcota bacterium]